MEWNAAVVRHRGAGLVVATISILLAGPAATLDTGTQAIWLGLGVLISGVPHGAVDHLRIASRLGRSISLTWLSAFVCSYAAVALAVAGVWWLLPLPSLVLFLLLSVHHFGSGDADDAFGVLVHGSLPILVPAAVHPDAVGGLFALLTGSADDGWQRTLHMAQPMLLASALVLLAVRLFLRRAGPRGDLLELIAIATAGAVLPPLLSFALYFCVWHAPRHVLHVARELWPGPPSRAVARFGAAALPMTLASLAGASIVFVLLPTDAAVGERWLQVIFVGLAALTVPHLLVTEALHRTEGPLARALLMVSRRG